MSNKKLFMIIGGSVLGFVLLLAGVGVGLLVLLGVATANREPQKVTYRVTCSYGCSNLTYTNRDGGIESGRGNQSWKFDYGRDHDPRTDDIYTYNFNVQPGQFVSLSAQAAGDLGIGAVTTEILINGEVVKKAHSEGDYSIASVSYRCCN